jgi:iron complex outermembrane receptor protein
MHHFKRGIHGNSARLQKACILTIATAVAAIMANAAFAQSANAPGNNPAVNDSLEEVVVTASRRTEDFQKAALDLAVVSGDRLTSDGVAQPSDLSKLVPNVKLTNGNTTSIYIRGVGENSAQQNSQSAIAVSTDGAYLGRTSAVAANFFDLERVEVLKGPQGTLYGRNASGGAINIISQKPTQEFGGFANFDIGNYDLRRISAAVNLPAGDTLAFRAALYDSKRLGYLSDGTQDEDQRAGRIHMLWKPSENLTLLVSAYFSHIGGEGDGGSLYGVGNGRVGATSSPQFLAVRAAQHLAVLSPNRFSDYHNQAYSTQLDWNLGFATLTTQVGYRAQTFNDGSAGTVTNGHSHQETAEMRLAHQGDKLKYVVGLYYFGEDVNYNFHLYQFQGFPLDTYQRIPAFNTRSKAAFGETTYSFTDSLRLTGGIRYTDENREMQMFTNWYGVGFASVPASAGGDIAIEPITGLPIPHYAYNNTATREFKNTSGKVGVEFDLSPTSMLFASVATGFKSGGFSISPPPTNTYEPEKLTAFTLGLKNRFFDNRLQVNAELFDWKYKNQQVSHLGFDVNGAAGFVTDNAGNSTIRGGDIDIAWRATRSDTFTTNLEYLSAVYDTYTFTTPFPDASGCKFSPTVVFGRNVQLKDCSGFRMLYTPQWSGNFRYEHQFLLASGSTLTFHAISDYASNAYVNLDHRPNNVAPGYATFDFDLFYKPDAAKWQLAGYVRNAGNKDVMYALNTTFTPPTWQLRPPRTFGLQMQLKF